MESTVFQLIQMMIVKYESLGNQSITSGCIANIDAQNQCFNALFWYLRVPCNTVAFAICRQLQAILLLRDGRFLLIRTSEMQSTVDTQANAQVYRCFVADSLWSIVMFAQDPKSREVLQTRVPERFAKGNSHLSQPKSPLERAVHVKLPRIEPANDVDLIDNPDFEHIFGSFRCACGMQPGEQSLFSSAELVQEEARRRLKPGEQVA